MARGMQAEFLSPETSLAAAVIDSLREMYNRLNRHDPFSSVSFGSELVTSADVPNFFRRLETNTVTAITKAPVLVEEGGRNNFGLTLYVTGYSKSFSLSVERAAAGEDACLNRLYVKYGENELLSIDATEIKYASCMRAFMSLCQVAGVETDFALFAR